jgi:arabinofuranosyltransferase
MPNDRESHGGILTLFLFFAAALLLHTFSYREYVTDDAYISFRYLKNYIAGDGLLYNPGERIWGYSNFLWLAVLYPAVRASIDPLTASRIIGTVCSVLTLALVLRWNGASPGAARRASVFGGLLLITSGAFALQAVGGLETSFYTLLLLSALFTYRKAAAGGRHAYSLLSGVLCALTAMTRPEGVFLYFILLCTALIAGRRSAYRVSATARGLSLGFLPVYALFCMAMFGYYGSLWPNSLDAKIGFTGEQLLRGLAYLRVFCLHYPSYALLLLLAAVWIRLADTGTRAAIAAALSLTVVSVIAGGDWMRGYRLLHPVIAILSLLLPFLIGRISEYLPGHARTENGGVRRLATAILLLFVLINIFNLKWDRHVNNSAYHDYVTDGIMTGQWLKSNLDADALLATNTGGTIAYFSGLRIVDMLGINDRVIARRSALPAAWDGIEKGDGAYVLSRKPDYIQFGSSAGSAEPVFLSDIELYRSEEFWNWYDLERYRIDESITLIIYKRRTESRPGPLPESVKRIVAEIAHARMQNSKFRY